MLKVFKRLLKLTFEVKYIVSFQIVDFIISQWQKQWYHIYSVSNEGKTVNTKKFIRTLNKCIHKYLSAIAETV